MVKALVTGGTGFVGSHIVRALVERGDSVRVMHRTTSRLDALQGLNYETAIGTLGDPEALRAACEGCDWVFHVAAVADYWRADVSRMMEVNVEGTRRILQAARDTGVKRLVFTSSAAAVGMRPYGVPADETVSFNLAPQAFPYGYSKWLAEQVVREAVEAGQDAVTVNPVVVMGPGDLNMISGSFITQIKRLQWLVPVTTGGLAVIDVRDVARGHIAAAEQGRTGQRYLLGTANYSYREWFAMIADVLGVARPVLPLPAPASLLVAQVIQLARRAGVDTPVDANQTRLGTHNIHFDTRKMRNELIEPQIDMVQSLEDTYTWYLDNGYIRHSWVEDAIRQIGKQLGIRPQTGRYLPPEIADRR